MTKNNEQKYKREYNVSLEKGGNTTSFKMKPSGEIILQDMEGNPAKEFLLTRGLSYLGQANKRRSIAEIYDTDSTNTSIFSTEGNDNIYVCDTNTSYKVYGERNFSVTAVSEVLTDNSCEELTLFTHFLIFWLWEGDYNIEPYAWEEAMRILTRLNCPGERCLFIVDAELGTLQEYNAGTRLLPSGMKLPKRFRLAYASADRSGSYMNSAIKQCDRVSRTIKDEIKSTMLKAFIESNMSDLDRRLILYGKLVSNGSTECIEYYNKWIGLFDRREFF